MKNEYLEYNIDWMYWSMMKSAEQMLNTIKPKEIEALGHIMPDMKDSLSAFLSMSEVGKLLSRAVKEWMDDIIHAHERGKKIVMSTFCYPVSVLRAFNCAYLNMEIKAAIGCTLYKRGNYAFLDYCTELGLTDTGCAGQRGSMGAFLAGAGTQPDLVVVNSPGFCDSNANSFQFYSAYKNIPFYTHDCPPSLLGDRAREYHRQDFRNMLKFMEKNTGNKIDWDFLRAAAQEIIKQDALVNELQTMLMNVPSPVPAFALLILVFVKLCFSGDPIGTAMLVELVKVSRENLKKGIAGTKTGKEVARVFPCYIDHYSFGMNYFNMFDKIDVSHIGCVLNYYWNEGAPYTKGYEDQTYHIDLSSEDAIIDSLADQLVRMPMVKSIIAPYNRPTQWLEDTLNAFKVFKADCCIYVGTLGCRNTWGMVKPFAMDLEKNGIPTYILFADAFDDRVTSWDVCEDRILEFLKVRKII